MDTYIHTTCKNIYTHTCVCIYACMNLCIYVPYTSGPAPPVEAYVIPMNMHCSLVVQRRPAGRNKLKYRG